MNYLSPQKLAAANREAIFNLFLYLSQKAVPNSNETLLSVLNRLKTLANISSTGWNNRDLIRLNIFENALLNDSFLAFTIVKHLYISKEGAVSCCFIKPNGDISVAFKGTGSGEWMDNAEGLSGLPEKNTYITYAKNGNTKIQKNVLRDYATDMQVDALNWFNRIAYENKWDESYNITVSGHSKGGNKAQFIALHSNMIDICYSFDGQGFSPEMIKGFERYYGTDFQKRRGKIISLSADNDYVNVLGNRLMPKENVYYFHSEGGLHYIEAILSPDGTLNPQTEQGKLSRYIEDVSADLMSLNPNIRRYATLGVMNIFRKYFGEKAEPKNTISDEETIAGIAISIGALLKNLKNKE